MPFGGERVRVSIGLCVKNCGRTVRDTVRSIVDQDFPREEMEIIVVDGESGDETVQIIARGLSEASLKFKICSDEGRGLAAARNMVIEKAVGEYVLWVDGDVILTNDFMKRQVKYMDENPNVAIAKGRRNYFGESLATRIQRADWEYFLKQYKDSKRILMIGLAPATICRVESLREVGGYDPKFKLAGEDTDLVMRISEKGSRASEEISINHEAMFYHVKDSFRDLIIQYIGYGYGSYYLKQKNSLKNIDIEKPGRRNKFSTISLFIIDNLLSGLRAYRLSHEKISFFIPFLLLIRTIGREVGYIKALLDGYGH